MNCAYSTCDALNGIHQTNKSVFIIIHWQNSSLILILAEGAYEHYSTLK